MFFSTLSTVAKVSLLSVLLVIAVVAVVIPMLADGRSSESSPPTTYSTDNTVSIHVLRAVRTELENMKIKISNKLDRTNGSSKPNSMNMIPLIIPENDQAKYLLSLQQEIKDKLFLKQRKLQVMFRYHLAMIQF